MDSDATVHIIWVEADPFESGKVFLGVFSDEKLAQTYADQELEGVADYDIQTVQLNRVYE